jgi:hypothetical protein
VIATLPSLRPDAEIADSEGKYLETVCRSSSPGLTVFYQHRRGELMIYDILIHPDREFKS